MNHNHKQYFKSELTLSAGILSTKDVILQQHIA